MTIRYSVIAALAAVLIGLPAAAMAQETTADETNKSNNPLTPAPGLNIQDYYAPDLYGNDKYTNDLMLRGALPLPPVGFVPVPQLIRLTAPISTRPDPGGGYSTGLGDINIFDIFLVQGGETQLGIGPLLTLPTASKDELGAGKWQAGLAGIAVHPTPQYLLAALLQWQASFAGDSDRSSVNTFTAQPVLIYNLEHGWYLRSTGIWTFNLRNNDYYIPVGAGAGKTWKSGTTIVNAFVEPQWTILHDGDNQPRFAIFAGINFTLGK
ncbi:MAG TPA: hypothetical protein VHB46_06620 [Burkholderiales bacterium]|nr:hypothetical protein [Burkholderiales bacterium]